MVRQKQSDKKAGQSRIKIIISWHLGCHPLYSLFSTLSLKWDFKRLKESFLHSTGKSLIWGTYTRTAGLPQLHSYVPPQILMHFLIKTRAWLPCMPFQGILVPALRHSSKPVPLQFWRSMYKRPTQILTTGILLLRQFSGRDPFQSRKNNHPKVILFWQTHKPIPYTWVHFWKSGITRTYSFFYFTVSRH